jgi:hypothetical protein
MHAIGIHNEARAECFGMQESAALAQSLGVPAHYAKRLAQLNLENYAARPPSYINRSTWREDGTWDLLPGEGSLPWHI